MWRSKEKAPVLEFLIWVILLSVSVGVIEYFLDPFSVAFAADGKMTVGYFTYAVIGILFSTPAPMIAIFITLKRREHITIKEFLRRIVATPNMVRAIVVPSCFCAAAFVYALLNGTPTGAPWYLMIIALPIMIIGGGVEEIGWRGFLQPALEKKLPFPLSTLAVAAIWGVWHFDLWLMPSSHHYGDSMIGFMVNILIWSFAFAAIYKATKTVFACVMYHAFINSLGAVFDWNALFDVWPGNAVTWIYRIAILAISIIIWVTCDRKYTKL